MKKEDFSKLFAPMVSSLIAYAASIALLAGFYVTKDTRLVTLASISLTAAPVPILVMMWELIDGGGEYSTRIVPYISKKKDIT